MVSTRQMLMLSLSLLLVGCNNYPYASPGLKPDGQPKIIWYQGLNEDPKSFDPQVAYDTVSAEVLNNIDETLYQYNYLKVKHITVEPSLADKMPTRQPDAQGSETYTIKIKKGVLFQDDPCFPGGKGRELTSDDFIYAIKRLADPFIKSPTASPVFPTFAASIVGLQEFYDLAKSAKQTDYKQEISGIKKVDNYTFTIHLKELDPQFVFWLALPFFAPTAVEATTYYDGQVHNGELHEKFMFHPVGTGAYKLKSWQRNQRIILARNPNYHYGRFPTAGEPGDQAKGLLADAGKELPFVDEAYFNIIRETVPMWTLFRQGYVDSLGDYGRGLKDTLPQVVSSDGVLTPEFQRLGVKPQYITQVDTFYYDFNMHDPIVGKNKKLRQAIVMAFDNKRFIDTFYSGVYIKPESILPPGLFGYDPNYKAPYARHDINRAKQLLKEAGYENGINPKTGKPLVLDVFDRAGGGDSQQRAQFLDQQLSKIGIRVNIRLVTFSQLLSIGQEGRFQMKGSSGWLADYPDPENFLFVLYSKTDRYTNASGYDNPEYDRLYNQMKQMEDTPARYAIIRKLIDILNEDVPNLYLYHEAYYTFSHPWTEHILIHPTAFNRLKYYKVNPQLRAEKQQEWNQPNYLFIVALFGLILTAVIPVVLARKGK